MKTGLALRSVEGRRSVLKGNGESAGAHEKQQHGIDQVRLCADELLCEKAPEIVSALGDKAVGGSERVVKLLLQLSKEHKEQSAVKESGSKRSLALQWAQEAEWVDSEEELRVGMPVPPRSTEKLPER
jgi:hypothetical protein